MQRLMLVIAAFVLALTYRSYRLNTAEEVSDDAEDTRVSQLAEGDGAPLEDDRPERDLAKDTDAPDELDALPGLEGSR